MNQYFYKYLKYKKKYLNLCKKLNLDFKMIGGAHYATFQMDNMVAFSCVWIG